jgi:hypothetical protein
MLVHEAERMLPGTGAAEFERDAWRHLADYLRARAFAGM